MTKTFKESIRRAYDNVSISSLNHLLDQSFYCYDYYLGVDRKNRGCPDLLLAESDDNNTTYWSLITPREKIYIGYSLFSENDIIHICFEEDL